MSRHGNKCVYDNINFDSESERDFYIKLKKFKQANKIKDFTVNPTYTLQDKFTTNYPNNFINYKEKPITYIIDYSVTLNDDTYLLVDTKSASGFTNEEVAKIKRKILSYQHQDIPIIFISKCPKYLCDNKEVWIENTNGRDLYSKLRNKYYNLYPEQKKKRGKKDITWTIEEWNKYFKIRNVDELFYVWEETYKVKKSK